MKKVQSKTELTFFTSLSVKFPDLVSDSAGYTKLICKSRP